MLPLINGLGNDMVITLLIIIFHFFFLNCDSNFIYFNFFIFLLLFKYSCLHFTPTTLPPIPTSHPQSYPSLALSMCPLYTFLEDPSPSFPDYPPPPSSGYGY